MKKGIDEVHEYGESLSELLFLRFDNLYLYSKCVALK